MKSSVLRWWLALLLLSVSPLVADDDNKSKRLLLLSQGPDGHPPGTHEYVAGIQVIAETLKSVPNVVVTVSQADGKWSEGPELIRNSDGVVLFLSQGAKWIHEDPRRLEAFGHLAGRGGGFVALHWGMGTREERHIESFVELFGGCHGGADRKYKVVDTRLTIAAPQHPILRGLQDFEVQDEFYYKLKFVDSSRKVESLLTATIEGQSETVSWAWQRGDGGRSFGFSGLHFHKNWQLDSYRRLVAQGILWTIEQPIPQDGLSVELP